MAVGFSKFSLSKLIKLRVFLVSLQVTHSLLSHDNVICTYHRAYDTNESEFNRINLCIDSIEAFLKGKPINTI